MTIRFDAISLVKDRKLIFTWKNPDENNEIYFALTENNLIINVTYDGKINPAEKCSQPLKDLNRINTYKFQFVQSKSIELFVGDQSLCPISMPFDLRKQRGPLSFGGAGGQVANIRVEYP